MIITMCYTGNMDKETPFGVALRHYRTQKGLTQKALAVSLGVSQATVTKLENGKIDGTATLRERIADWFKVSYSDFLEKGKKIISERNIIPLDNILSQFEDKGTARLIIETLADIESKEPKYFDAIKSLVLREKMALLDSQKKRSS